MGKMVFVVYEDRGHEGCSKPFRAFSTEALANLFIEGASFYSSQMKIIALGVEAPADFDDDDKGEAKS